MNQCYLCELSPIKSLIPKTVGVKSFFLGLLLKNDATAKYNFKYLQKKLRSKRGVKKKFQGWTGRCSCPKVSNCSLIMLMF